MVDWTTLSVPRYRVLSDSGDWSTYLESHSTTPPSSYDFSTPRSYRATRLFKGCWDCVVPNWKSRMNNGEIITNDLVEVSLTSNLSPAVYNCKAFNGNNQIVYHGAQMFALGTAGAEAIMALPDTWAEVYNLVVPDVGSLRAEAVTAAYARVDVSELELLASLGEMPETVDWFRDVLKRLIAAMAALKKRQYLDLLNQAKTLLKSGKGRKRAAKRTAALTEDSWMEWRYAIRPLIFEVQAYLAALETKIESEHRKTARKSTFDIVQSTSYQHTSDFIFKTDVKKDSTISRHIRAGVLYSLNPELTGWWTHLGLDAPVSAAWAVTRLSFVLDWFFNIGQWIASWEPRLGLTPLTSWVVETRSEEITGTPMLTNGIWVPNTITERTVTDLGGYFCKLQTKARWANPERQILPTFNYRGLNVAKVADLVIIGRKLAAQLLR